MVGFLWVALENQPKEMASSKATHPAEPFQAEMKRAARQLAFSEPDGRLGVVPQPV